MLPFIVVYLGIEFEEDNDDNPAIRYRFVDNFNDRSFFEQEFQLPWAIDKPDFEDGQDCIVWSVDFGGLENEWNDIPCETEVAALLCRRESLECALLDDENDDQPIFSPPLYGALTTLVALGILFIGLFMRRESQSIKEIENRIAGFEEGSGTLQPSL